MNKYLKRFFAHARFHIAKVPHQIMHHTLRHDRVRKPLVKIFKRFPALDQFLRARFVGSQQRLAKERIVFQRYSLPNLVISKNRRISPVDPVHLAKIDLPPYSVDQILKNIQKELS